MPKFSFPLLSARAARLNFSLLVVLAGALTVFNPGRVYAQCPTTGTTFSSSDDIETPNNNDKFQTYVANIYPSTITTTGLAGSVCNVTLTLNGVYANNLIEGGEANSSGLNGVEVLLVSPDGGHMLQFMGSVGPTGSTGYVTNLNMTFEDSASNYLPDENQTISPATGSGSWKPSSYDTENGLYPPDFPSPGPGNVTTAYLPGGYETYGDGTATLTSAFTGATANGGWKLYLVDDSGDPVEISGGWSLTLYTLATSIPTTTSLSSSTNPAYNASTGNTTTFTATVSSDSGTPTGTVTFSNNGVALSCSPTGPEPLSGGIATCTTTFSAGTNANCESATGSQGSSVCQGNNTIKATYSGSGNWVGGSGTMDEVIEAHPTISGNTYCNESPFYMPGDSTPQAYPSIINVSGVSSSEVSNVSVQLNNMNGDAPTNQYLLVSPDGNHNFDFLDFAWNQSNSSDISVTVEDGAAKPIANTPASSGTYAAYDDNLSNPDGFPAAGSISGVPQVPGTVVDAEPKGNVTNTFETEFNGATSNGNWALYALDNENSAGGYVGNWCITLTPAAANNSATTLTTNVADQYTGQPVTLTATVKDGATLITSGTVTFLDNGAVPAGTTSGDNVVQLGSNGQATFTTSSLTQGDHPFTANYGGDATYNPSEGTVVQRIDNASVATSPASNQYQFCNTGAVESTTGAKGAFTPNPSNVFVTNLPGTVSSVNVTLNGFFTDSTETLDETEALLQGPNGTAGNNLDFFSNTGNLNETLTNATLTFSDSASGNVPAGSGWGSGTYKPTAEDNINSDADQFFSSSSSLFNAPTNISYADPRGSSTLGSEFAGANGNGTYSLFFNVLGEDSEEGAAGGWCADFTENPVTVTPTVSHSGSGEGGDFVGGETNAAITADIAVASNGGPTGDPLGTNPLTVIDTLNSNLTYSSSTGTGWTCSASTQVVTCTNDSAVAQNSTYPTLTIDVNVAASPTAGSITNKMSLSGAGITATSSNTDTIAIDTPPAITSGASTTFTVGTAGSFTVTATGSPAPTFSEIGDLPSGVTFSSGGVLSGTPAAGTGGSYPIVITASNGASPNAIQSFTLTVDQAPAITSGASTTFAVGTAGSFTVVGGGYPAPTFSETGSLPSGVTLSTGGVLSGTPAAGTGGSYPIVITASNGVGTSATQDFTLTVDQAPAITSGASATFTAGTAGSFTVTATGSPAPTFSETGSLPSGVTLSTGGVLSGTPAAGTGGSYPITITASNGASPNATQNFTLTVDQAPAITSGASTTFAVGTAGSFTVTGTGYPAPTFSETGSLPSGVTLSTGGVLSGTPAAGTGGSYPITITASNGASPNAIQSFTLTVDQAPTITSANSTSFQVGAAGTFPVIASGYPIPAFTITAGTLPTGVTLLDNGNGTATLSGTPALGTNGSYPITIQAANGIGSPGDQSFTLTVNGASILVVDVSTDDAGSAGNCAVQTSPTQNTGNTSCSLRDALAESQTLGAASIYFYPGAFTSPTTITETNGTLAIPANTEIFGLTSGTGTNRITVKGASGSVFSLSSGLTGSLANLNITGGSAAPGSGGGIESNGTLTVMACTIYNNSAFSGGGIMNNGSLAVADSTFYNNSASSGGGGGIMNYFTATLTVASSTFYNNSANSSIGGAIDSIAGAGAATVTGSTISGNSANDGGGISAGSTFTISNSIVAGNTASADADGTGNFTDAGNNLIGDGTGWSGISNGSNGNQVGTTATPINPELAPLANYGGPTQTMIPLPGSAAICAGSASTAANADLTSDQRGEAMSLTTGNASSYTGLGGYCPAGSVDAGAVQTNYSLSFSTEPQPITPATTIYQNTNFEAGVTLDESGTPFTAAGETIPLTLTGTGTLSGGSATTSTSTGIASYSTLQVSSAGPTDTLAANLTLNLGVSPAATISTISSPFAVAAPTTVSVTVGTNLSGLSFTVDNTTYTSPQNFVWNLNSQHTLVVTSPQGSNGTRYTFTGWSDGTNSTTDSVTAASSTTSYTANFGTSYLLTTAVSPSSADGSVGASVPSPTSDGYYPAGTPLNLTATANAGYTFSNWAGTTNSTTNPLPITMNGPITETANFGTNNVNVTVGTSPLGLSFTVDSTAYTTPQTFSWQVGSKHTIATTSPQGSNGTRYTFTSWSNGGAMSQMVTVAAATTYTASFSTSYLLTTAVSPAGGGTVTVNTASPTSNGYYSPSTIVSLSATPSAGYVFSGWTGPVAGPASAITTVAMNAPESVTANFTLASVVSVSPTSIDFGTLYLGSIITKTVTVKNTGKAAITLTDPFIAIVKGGDSHEFVTLNLCPKSLAAGKSCTMTVSFIAGPYYTPQTATLTISYNGPGSPQSVPLTATVIDPVASFNPSSLNFGSVKTNSGSATKSITVTSTGGTELSISKVSLAGSDPGDFSESNNCASATLNPKATCSISVTFRPTKKGSRGATLVVTDSAKNGSQSISLSGSGD